MNRSFFVNIRGFAVVSSKVLINFVKFKNKSVSLYVFRDLAIKIIQMSVSWNNTILDNSAVFCDNDLHKKRGKAVFRCYPFGF